MNKEQALAVSMLRDFARGHCNMASKEAALVAEAIDQLSVLPVVDIECGIDCIEAAAAQEMVNAAKYRARGHSPIHEASCEHAAESLRKSAAALRHLLESRESLRN